MLNAASKLKGEKDWMKYEVARKLHKRIRKIRENYHEDFKSKEMKIRQRAVALYFIDKVCVYVCLSSSLSSTTRWSRHSHSHAVVAMREFLNPRAVASCLPPSPDTDY